MILYTKGKVNLYLGNCMELMASKPDNYYDLAVVDPPYGIGVTAMKMGGRKTVMPDKTKKWDKKPAPVYFHELKRVSENQIIWGGNYFNLPSNKSFIIWDKGETMYRRDFAECEYAWTSHDRPAKIYKLSPVQLDRIHTTQKPVKLYDWILDNYAKPEFKILDTHGGSFSSAIAAYYFGCEFDIIEIDEDYYNDGLKRFKLMTMQTKLF